MDDDRDWNMDLDPYPGPLDNTLSFAELGKIFAKIGMTVGEAVKQFEPIVKAFSRSDHTPPRISLIEYERRLRPMKVSIPVRNDNHGPRSSQTYDRHGRRRY